MNVDQRKFNIELNEAIRSGSSEEVEELISKGADPSTALLLAVYLGNFMMVEELLFNGADPNYEISGENSLALSLEKNRNDIANILFLYGADIEKLTLGREILLYFQEMRRKNGREKEKSNDILINYPTSLYYLSLGVSLRNNVDISILPPIMYRLKNFN